MGSVICSFDGLPDIAIRLQLSWFCALTYLVQRLIKIGYDVFDVFYAGRCSDETRIDPGSDLVFFTELSVRCAGRMKHASADIADMYNNAGKLEIFQKLLSCSAASLDCK